MITAKVLRPDAETVQPSDGDELTLPDLLFDWKVRVEDLWPPVFDEAED